jgi:hypothetical protein
LGDREGSDAARLGFSSLKHLQLGGGSEVRRGGMSQKQEARIPTARRIGFAALIGIGAGVGIGIGVNSVGLGIAIGFAVFLIFGLEFS